MKKITIVTLCLLALGSTVFAYDLSVGFGAVFGIVNDKFEASREYKTEYDWTDLDFSRLQYGAFAFFGTRYTEFNFSARLSRNKFVFADTGEEDNDDTLMLTVGAYGKIPISFGTTFVLFPTIGIDFDAVDRDMYLWFRGGLGLDIFFTERVFLRAQALYGYGIAPFYLIEKATGKYDGGYENIKPGHGPLAKLGIGWMF